MKNKNWRVPPVSDHYANGKFRNLSPTSTFSNGKTIGDVLWERLHRPSTVIPSHTLPSVSTNLKELSSEAPSIVWFGHSSYLIVCREIRILVDPVFSGRASPLPGLIPAFKGADAFNPEDFPSIDYLIITHNHYDHLDKRTLARLWPKVKKVYTSIGVGKDLEPGSGISVPVTEMDWWETERLDENTTLTATPARHFSGRGLIRDTSLWSSFVLDLFGYRLYIGGDSGYDSHFSQIGERYGPFDLAILECGQYNLAWQQIHLLPEETAIAATELRAKLLLPVHWAKFALANHPWNEPLQRLLPKATELGLPVATPMIGEVLVPGHPGKEKRWWEI